MSDAVEVAVAERVDGTYTYGVPPGMELQLGHAVLVPFGRRKLSGYVIGPGDASVVPAGKLKRVARLLDPAPAFDEAQLRFFRWAARYYLVGLGQVISTALPSAYNKRGRTVVLPTDEGVAALAEQAEASGELAPDRALVLREVVAHPGRTEGGLARKLQDELERERIRPAIEGLRRAGLVVTEHREPKGIGNQITVVKLAAGTDAGALPPTLGARMRGVLARLIDAEGELSLRALVQLEGPGARDAVKRLETRGLVERSTREDKEAAVTQGVGEVQRDVVLNGAQQAAVDAVVAGLGAAGTFLLHGVTGSGKTEVYLRIAAEVLARGLQVLLLVPEIALTPQLTGRVKARFGDRVAVLHSGLGGGERLREWRRIRAGEADVAVGARSALFAPFKQLGLVVVDEEHDDSYKQDDTVPYHARDLGVVLARLVGCPVLLGSATPSLESFQNAADGRYTTLSLPQRATPRPVPRIELLDMRGLPPTTAISPPLGLALRDVLDRGEQAIVLYNRRGYAPVVECPGCGSHYECPSCGVGMVFHRRRRRLLCHYCGFHQTYQDDCPACGTAFAILGHGTERVAEDLEALFPDVAVARMDLDTVATKGAHQRILSKFRAGDARLLVGTQLVAKGHDFPGVSFAAVVGVDHLLGIPDFRSAERTWALVTQLAGRAGRGEQAGRVLVQTRHVDHFVFRTLAEGGDFYAEETRLRRVMGYPPFTRLVLLRISATSRDKALGRARELSDVLRASARKAAPHRAIDILGPTPAPMPRKVKRWRFQIVLRGRDVPRFRAWLQDQRAVLRKARGGGVRVGVDVDPRSLL